MNKGDKIRLHKPEKNTGELHWTIYMDELDNTIQIVNNVHEDGSFSCVGESWFFLPEWCEILESANMNFNSFSKEVYKANLKKGFDTGKENIGQTLMLIVTELAEALEAHRKGKSANVLAFYENKEGLSFKDNFEKHIKDTFEDEMADALIRIHDLAGAKEIDLDFHVRNKLLYNATRPYKHGKKY